MDRRNRVQWDLEKGLGEVSVWWGAEDAVAGQGEVAGRTNPGVTREPELPRYHFEHCSPCFVVILTYDLKNHRYCF